MSPFLFTYDIYSYSCIREILELPVTVEQSSYSPLCQLKLFVFFAVGFLGDSFTSEEDFLLLGFL